MCLSFITFLLIAMLKLRRYHTSIHVQAVVKWRRIVWQQIIGSRTGL
uniref:Uncharacterized protein n=1 Tax=Arundo donax TaxID=35708 RepID=A0A0A9BS81_ARUDO